VISLTNWSDEPGMLIRRLWLPPPVAQFEMRSHEKKRLVERAWRAVPPYVV
jgi:hypothetical protein